MYSAPIILAVTTWEAGEDINIQEIAPIKFVNYSEGTRPNAKIVAATSIGIYHQLKNAGKKFVAFRMNAKNPSLTVF